jgi:uncharacterized protein (TIGR02147 family)
MNTDHSILYKYSHIIPTIFFIFNAMKAIFKYIDYRHYLADFYAGKKSTTRHFSYRYFAHRAGIKSPVFLKQVIVGKRNLTRTMIEKFVAAIGLNKREAVFFRQLVQFNQAKTASEKQETYGVLLSMIEYVKERQLSGDHYRYFDKWYHSVIRELVCLRNFGDDFNAIARAVTPRIKPGEAEKSLRLLLRLNLVEKQKDGTCRQTDSAIASSDDMVALARRSFNSEMLRMAIAANETLPPSERNVSGITMGISRSCYDILLAEMTAFKERVKAIVNQDKASDRVYQLNLQLFPLSKELTERKPGESGSEPCV